MEVELTINLLPNEDGTAVLTVEGPVEGVVAAYSLLMHMIQGLNDAAPPEPEQDEGLSDSSVG
jgi:hypothetical protein